MSMEACIECGHLHYDISVDEYVDCPIDECKCVLSD